MNIYDVEADIYDLFYFSFDRDIPLYRKFICDRVLELFCGTGRILKKLNPDYGVGIDISEKMLSNARKNLAGMNIRLVQGDARSFHLNEKFCLVIIGLNSLMMFPRDDRIRILTRAREHLSPGGRVIVDIINPYMMVEGIVHHGDTVTRDDVVYSRFFVPRWKEDHWDLLYFYDTVRDGIVHRKYANLNLYPIYPEDLEEEARESGLKILALYGDYDMREYEENSDKIIAVLGVDDE